MRTVEDVLLARRECVQRNSKGRKVVIWGTGGAFAPTLRVLNLNQSDILAVQSPGQPEKDGAVSADVLNGKANEYYVVVSLYRELQKIKDLLSGYGYACEKDYCYFPLHQSEKYTAYPANYKDAYGNCIIGDLEGAKVNFCGKNSVICIRGGKDDNQKRKEGLLISIGSNSHIGFADNVQYRHGVIHCKNNSRLTIGESCLFNGNGSAIFMHDNSICELGGQSSFAARWSLHVARDSCIKIGRDVMISWDVAILSNDGHAVFDIGSGKNINYDGNLHSIIIEDHVWIGRGSTVLKDTVIGVGCILGANSVVKGNYPNNCMIAGNPARIIRTDISWHRDASEQDMGRIPAEYRRHTVL